jgi:hypothetical protein
MRFIVLLFGLVSCLITAVFGALFLLSNQFLVMLHEWNVKELDTVFLSFDKDPRVGLFLLLASAAGLLGALLAFFRCGWQGALLLFAPLVGPVFLSPIALVGVFPQAFTGLLSIFVRPLPIPSQNNEDDD